jgi:RES domain-containing protein
MKITAWRIAQKKYVNNAFSGEGAKIFGGRWNPVGYPMVYAAQNLSLAILELIVHLDDDSDITRFVAIPVTIDKSQVHVLPQSQLPENWFDLPISEQSQVVGKKWLEQKQSLLLQVPSSVVPSESNFLINPLHPQFVQLKIGSPQSLCIDQRISKLLH